MAALPPPEGMTEEDYDAIHAAVVETVRGRWFLAEFSRRNRVDEVQDMLAAIGRLEAIVTGSRAALPPPAGEASPHLRLLNQRADEISTHLADIIDELRATGVDAYLCDDLEREARAVASLAKGASAEPVAPPARALASEARPALEAPIDPPPETVPTAAKPAPLPPWTPAAPSAPPRAAPLQMSAPVSRSAAIPGEDPRLAALAALDRLSLAEKLALFA